MGHSNGTNAAPPNAGRSSQNDADVISRPAKIEIPSIDVTSPLITVGLDPDGAIQVPQPGRNYDKAAWFRGSPAPGEHGPAVIEGHVDGDVNGPSVFYRLGELQPSDQVRVTSVNGGVMHFEVYAVRLYPKSDFPTLKVYGNTRGPELRLITCGGSFDPNRTEGGYTSDVVVYAREV
jgi:LPXTG-site transpeptidase (sortase) family protein